MNIKWLINVVNTTIKRIQKKSDVKKKKKIKITHDFVTDEKMINAIIIKKSENNAQSILHCSITNELIENDHKK